MHYITIVNLLQLSKSVFTQSSLGLWIHPSTTIPLDITHDIVYNYTLSEVYVDIHSVREAADQIGISDSHCRRLLEKGLIEGKKLGHDWVVLSLDYKRKRKPIQRRVQ